jgi:hypothetical protein
MTNLQLYLAIGVPSLVNIGMITFLYLALAKRMDDFKDIWRAELLRVEQVLDARLKHLEERER